MLKMYLKQPNPLKSTILPARKAGQKSYVKTPEHRFIPLLAEWEKTKGHLTGTIKLTAELAALFQTGNEIKIMTFPEKPRPAPKAYPQQKPEV